VVCCCIITQEEEEIFWCYVKLAWVKSKEFLSYMIRLLRLPPLLENLPSVRWHPLYRVVALGHNHCCDSHKSPL
jgi:hypothetical protein